MSVHRRFSSSEFVGCRKSSDTLPETVTSDTQREIRMTYLALIGCALVNWVISRPTVH